MKCLVSTIIVALFASLSGCQPTCPPALTEPTFDGEGFLVTQDAQNFMVVFVPACQIDKHHYLQSLRKENLGDGITVGLYNMEHFWALMDPRKHFALVNPVDTLSYRFKGVYIAPVRLHYQNLKRSARATNYAIDFKLKAGEVSKPYVASSQEIVSLEFLPYAP